MDHLFKASLEEPFSGLSHVLRFRNVAYMAASAGTSTAAASGAASSGAASIGAGTSAGTSATASTTAAGAAALAFGFHDGMVGPWVFSFAVKGESCFFYIVFLLLIGYGALIAWVGCGDGPRRSRVQRSEVAIAYLDANM